MSRLWCFARRVLLKRAEEDIEDKIEKNL